MAVQQAGRSRTRNWEEVEVRFFLEMWAEEEIQQQLDGTVRNKKVFRDMAERMAEAGYIRTAEQLRDKLKKLKKDYKDARSNNESSGAGRQQCPFYDILHQIMGHRPTLEPEVLIDTADDKSQDGQRQEDDEADDVVQVPPAPAPATATTTDVEEANPTPENQEADQSTSSDGSTPKTTIGKRKRRQPSTSSRQEEAMDKVAKRLIDHQDVARRENREWEERREEEQERREERRRQEEREHELRLFQMMGQMLQQQQQKVVTTPAGRSYMDM